MTDETITRRRMVQVTGGIAAAGLAGCLDGDDSPSSDDGMTEDGGMTEDDGMSGGETADGETSDEGGMGGGMSG